MRVFKATTTNEVTKTHYDDYAFRSNQDAAPVPTRKRKPAPEKRGARRASAKDDDEEEQGDDERTSSPKRSSRIYATPVPAPDMQISVEQATYLKPWVTRFFHIQIEREIRHENTHTGKITENAVPGGVRPIVRTQNLPSTRSYCDVCATGIFMGSYMCGCCGREMCLGCMETWTPSGEVTAGRLNRIDTCTKKRRHQHDQMMFLTRARPGALVELMKQLIFHEQAVPGLSQDDDATLKLPEITAPSPSTQNYLPVPTTKHEDLPLEAFQKFWRLGKPLVLTGLKDKFELPWDAQYFVDKYGTERCQLHDCAVDSNEPYEGRVDDFFAEFGGTTPESLKLKDWPPTTEFKKAFPELFADFENAVPYPTYTRRSGPLNLASHFPETWVAPDLGPKMYNAYPAPDFLPLVEKPEAKLTRGEKHVLVQDIKGTTNLHLDLTDAVNVMLYADGGRKAPKCTTVDKKIPLCGAIWDIFPRFANVPLREYLKKKDKTVDDPIHRHKYYLSEFDLEQLAKMGVHSYRIFQNPGDAVFIPAGCAHQVRNRRACIKVAVDFLSPENLFVCKDILEEFRAMAPKVARAGTKGMQKEDVLQLWSCVGFAWDAVARVLDLGDEAEDAKESLIAGNAGKGKKSVKSKAKGKQVAVE
ncbi:hypothetical protein BZA05DRAFT_434806, partial [Tricharina praecox]|uniref:uncharacterized protein n=1 Tax=Tricharina praecox TaxID=43433 RepID=UPI00221F6600